MAALVPEERKVENSRGWLPAALLLVLYALVLAALKQRQQPQRSPIAAGLAPQGEAPAAATAPLPACEIKLGGDPRWADRCDLLTHVCVDQGAFVLQGRQYQPTPGRPAAPLPTLHAPPGVKYIAPWTGNAVADLYMEAEAGRPYYSLIDMPRVRAARAREGAPDLASPAFSSCTVPIIWLPNWQENFFHAYLETASVLHSMLAPAPWAQHAKLVVPTPEGLALPAHLSGLLAPLSNLSVESLADFSARGTPAAGPGEQQAQSTRRDSYEGGHHRCYRQLYWCGQQAWGGIYPLTAFGQRLLQHHGYDLPPPSRATSDSVAAVGSSQPAAGSVPAAAPAAAASQQPPLLPPRPLRVLFQQRSGAGRQLLNVDALVEACRAWRAASRGQAKGQPPAANCSRVALGSLEATLAAAQEADILVGMHGANLVSGFLMRPGGIVIEVWNYGFVEGPELFLNAAQQDPDLTTSWWTIRVGDPTLSRPGPYEAASQEPRKFWARDRNAHVPWPALRVVLEAAVAEAARGGTEAYRAAAAARSQVWTLLPGRRLQRAGGAEQQY